jgi:hypothetical protein
MKKCSVTLALWFVLSSLPSLAAPDEKGLIPQLEPLRPWIGKTWRGKFKASTPEKPQIDVAHWERALNGQAIRVLHSMNDGMYGGETIITWSKEKQSLIHHYFSTAGFQTSGTIKVTEGKLLTHEVVTGAAEGVTEVRSTITLHPDGTMSNQAEFLRNGKWEPGHEITYREDQQARVIFR